MCINQEVCGRVKQGAWFGNKKPALVIEGGALIVLGIGIPDDNQTPEMKECQVKFIEDASKCQAVLCCRVSPKQKGDITRLVKRVLGQTTLGVGDGANDVDMIKAAHVGVGIQVCVREK